MSPTGDFAATIAEKLVSAKGRRPSQQPAAPVPAPKVIAKVLDTLYFASLKTEEGRSIQVRIFYVDPGSPDPDAPPRIRIDRWRIFRLGSLIKLTVPNLVKLAKAADPWASGLAVYYTEADGPFVWGMVDQVVHWNMAHVGEASGYYSPPGQFHAVINGAADITVLRGDSFLGRLVQDEVIGTQNDCLWDGEISDRLSEWIMPVWRNVFEAAGKSALAGWRQQRRYEAKELWTKTLSRILINIQRQRHGGAILFRPSRLNEDLAVKYSLDYRRVPEAIRLSLFHMIQLRHIRDMLEWRRLEGHRTVPRRLYAREYIHQGEIDDAEQTLTGSVRFISSMAGVDGLILASPDFSIEGFGVEITTKQEPSELRVTTTADPQGARVVDINSYGTRHRSMIRYCAQNPESVGFVVSQDGDIRAVMRVRDQTVLFENMKTHSLWDDDFSKKLRDVKVRKSRKNEAKS